MLSHVREGVWRSQPLFLAQWAASRSHRVQPAASITEPEPEPVGQPDNTVAVHLVDTGIHVIFLGLVALLYAKNKPNAVVIVAETENKTSLDGDFKHGLFSCCETPGLMCFTWCCLTIRWSDSARMAGFLAFPTAILVVIAIQVVGLQSGLLVWIGFVITGTIYRQKLRKLFGMEDGNTTVVADCLKWSCCMCCAVVQEARQLEEAKLLGHDAVRSALPLQLNWDNSAPQAESPYGTIAPPRQSRPSLGEPVPP